MVFFKGDSVSCTSAIHYRKSHPRREQRCRLVPRVQNKICGVGPESAIHRVSWGDLARGRQGQR